MTISVVNYGVGNLGSILNMLKKVGVDANVASSPADVEGAEKLLLPGVGSFDSAMHRIHQAGLFGPLNDAVRERQTPILGICLGMQLLTRRSEEGEEPGFGWIPAVTVKFGPEVLKQGLRIPHMGWNVVEWSGRGRVSIQTDGETRFYFAHSYHVVCDDSDFVAGVTTHGYEYASVVEKDNVIGAQFHPEKSHRFGQSLLTAFAKGS